MAKGLIWHLQRTLACTANPRKQEHLAPYASVLTLHSLGVLPSDPLIRHIPGSTVTLIFRNYTITLNRVDSNQCVRAALADVFVHGDRIFSNIDYPREYAWGTVELSVFPIGTMRWVELSYTAHSIQAWLNVYDSVDMNFDVVVNGVGVVGTGRLANVI